VVWDEKLSKMAKEHLVNLGYSDLMEYTVGEATEALRQTPGPFDLVFCDIDKHGYPAALPVMKEKTVNLVPINYVVQAIRAIYESHSHFGKTFHLTNPKPPTLQDLTHAMERVFETGPPRFVTMTQYLLNPPSTNERFIIKMVERYAPYLRFPEAEFDQANIQAALSETIDGPVLSTEQIERLVAVARTKQPEPVL